MIRVTVEMLPHGDASRARILGVGYISNDGKGSADVGSYDVKLMKSAEYAKSDGVWKSGHVPRFLRSRLGPWDLLYLALKACVGYRN